MITCQNLTVSYGAKEILHQLSFHIAPNELTVIMGANGSGKTTLFHALCGTVPYQGQITIAPTGAITTDTIPSGIFSSRDNPGRSAPFHPRQLSLMPQILPSPHITLRELAAFGRHPYTGFTGILSKRDWEIVDQTLERLSLTDLAGSYLSRLSGGELRKAYLAMALVKQAPILLADEPCANLDSKYSKQLLSLFKEQRKAGDTILCILHDLNQAFSIADKLLILEKGHLIFHGTPAEAMTARIPETYFDLHPVTGTDENGQAILLYH